MKFRNTVLPVFSAGIWVSFSEFLRNELLFKSIWITHYQGLGLEFPAAAINNALWGVWSFVFGAVVLMISIKFNILHTTLIAWLAGFGLMWIVTWNMGVLPLKILPVAVPLSLLETFVAAWICRRMAS
jgi:hypothetical protein